MINNMTQPLDIENLSKLVPAGLDEGAFFAYFQPKIDPDSDEIVSLEALLRWQHPTEGFCEAGWFMPTIERSDDLTKRVDAWVLQTTTQQGQAWLDEELSFGTLNINISAWTAGAELVDMVRDALSKSGFPAKYLALECPWRLLAAHGEAITPTLRALKALGCKIVLDGNPLDQDCLDQVHQTPVQMSKVCIKYIQEFSETHGNRALSSLIKSWHRRGVNIVSMGVEDKEQADLSHKIGIRESQGNRFKSPLPAEEITFLLSLIKKTKKALSLL